MNDGKYDLLDNIREIERDWKDNFLDCALVVEGENDFVFSREIAKKLYFGEGDRNEEFIVFHPFLYYDGIERKNYLYFNKLENKLSFMGYVRSIYRSNMDLKIDGIIKILDNIGH